MPGNPNDRRQDRRRGRPRPPPKHRSNANGSDQAVDHSQPRPDRPAPRQQQPPKLELSEAVPQDTPTFQNVADQNIVHPAIMQAIIDDLKFNHMMPVQAATLWELLPPNSSDCLVQAKTGTGKTVAFLLPALQTMLTKKAGADRPVSLLVLSPTRELAMQIAAEATALLARLRQYRVRIAIGGTNKDREERQILSGCDVLIATPGRLIDHMSNENIRYAFRELDTLVLDEADRLLDMGFLPALKDIVSQLPDRNQVNRQGMLFSATVAAHVNKVASLVLSPQYKFISTIPEGEMNTHKRVPQMLIKVPHFADVAPAMVAAIRKEAAQHQDFKAIVFAPTAKLADFYGYILSHLGGLPAVSALHSRMSQNKRTKITNDYRNATSAILVATDVIARGMDFAGVKTVFQVGIPSEKESYIHRLGRTARADAEGRGIFLITEDESFFPRWTLKDITFTPEEADLTPAGEVEKAVEGMEEDERCDIYRTWLGYYNNHLKGLRWDREELVRQANTFARTALGTADTPPIERRTVGKMGLRGIRGLNIVPDRPRQRQGQGGGRPKGGANGR